MDPQIKIIVTATDFSRFSEGALPQAALVARQFGAALHLVHVLERPEDVPWWLAEQEYHARRGALEDEAKAHLRKTVETFFPDVDVTPHLRIGSPSQQILAAADELKADLVVIATHGRGGLSRLLFGSVAGNVVRESPCPVMTVRPDQIKTHKN